jgi:hypothetical protein
MRTPNYTRMVMLTWPLYYALSILPLNISIFDCHHRYMTQRAKGEEVREQMR